MVQCRFRDLDPILAVLLPKLREELLPREATCPRDRDEDIPLERRTTRQGSGGNVGGGRHQVGNAGEGRLILLLSVAPARAIGRSENLVREHRSDASTGIESSMVVLWMDESGPQ